MIFKSPESKLFINPTRLSREEARIEFTGLAHDHLMASSRMQSVRANTLHHHHMNNPTNQQQQQQQQQQPSQPLGCLNSIQDRTNIQETTDANVSSPPQSVKQNDAIKLADGNASALSTIAILRRQTMFDSLVLVKKFRPCLDGYTLEFPTSYVDDKTPIGDACSPKTPAQIDNQTSVENQTKREQDLGCGRTKLVSVYLDGDDPIYQCHGSTSPTRNGFKAEGGDIVYVPVNGLLHRLDNYDRQGVSIDSRVYAFAMGLKTAERFLTSSSEKEIQEAPPL